MDAISGNMGTTTAGTRRMSTLLVVLAAVVVAFAGRAATVYWPHIPRVIVENQLPDAIDGLTVEDSSRTLDLGSVPSDGRLVLAIDFRPGERYVIHGHTISGDELISQLEIARREHRDVRIKIYKNGEGFHYVSIEGDKTPD